MKQYIHTSKYTKKLYDFIQAGFDTTVSAPKEVGLQGSNGDTMLAEQGRNLPPGWHAPQGCHADAQ